MSFDFQYVSTWPVIWKKQLRASSDVLFFNSRHFNTITLVRFFPLQLCPDDVEDYIRYLRSNEKLDECALQIVKRVINNDRFQSKEGKGKIQYWNDLCDLISTNPRQIKSLNVDAVIRDGIGRFPEQRGRLWNALADYYIRSGQFEKARDIYEEAIDTVTMVRDFTQIYDAYAQFEEVALSTKMDKVAESGQATEDDDLEIELRMLRLEQLIERRPLLINR